MKFKSDIEVQAGIKDSSGNAGTSGQVLSSNGGTVAWADVNTSAETVQNQVKAGVAINKGQAVYVTSADGTNIIVGLASNTSEGTSSKTLGLLNATVAINDMADVVQIGRLAGLDTSTAIVGDPVWLGANGNLIYGLANKPYAPLHLVYIGVVTRVNANNGEIFVTVQNGFELDELHNVAAQNPTDGDTLKYISSTGLWTACAASPGIIVLGSGTCSTQRIGVDNNASGNFSFAGGGQCNLASVPLSNPYPFAHSTVAGGFKNSSCGVLSFIGGGYSNTVTGTSIAGTISGGSVNNASGPQSSIGGGSQNSASGAQSVISGGVQNTTSGSYSAIGGGRLNVASNCFSTIAGGCGNTAIGAQSSIGGGIGNTACGTRSAISGGSNNTIKNAISNHGFDFIGGGNSNYIYNTVEDSSGNNGKNFIGGGCYNKIYGSDAGKNVISGGANNKICGIYACISVIGGGANNTIKCEGSVIAGGRGNTIYQTSSFIGGGSYNKAYATKSVIVGGDGHVIGTYGYNSFIGSGSTNKVCKSSAVVVGGDLNEANAQNSFIGGGRANCINNTSAISKDVIVGGECNLIINGQRSFIGGGYNNRISSSCNSTIAGGGGFCYAEGNIYKKGNDIELAANSFIGGGKSNIISCYSDDSTISGGSYNNIGTNSFGSTIGGGFVNRIQCFHSVVSGGCNNRIYSFNTAITGGKSNWIYAGATYGFIGGGGANRIGGTATKSSVVGGQTNKVCAAYSAILGGCNNTVNHARSFISGSGLTSSATCTTFVNALSKTSGTFRINHPDPVKTETHYLQHSFVESPTGGDNIYRFTITTINGIGTIVLPDYYKFLNKEDQIWVTAKNHFGLAYGIINEEQTEITINSDVDGEYNVLLIGTRKDIDALDGWQGVEVWK